ncbi:MAG: BatA domain-containing protein [Gemmatimonadaceae bacterium]
MMSLAAPAYLWGALLAAVAVTALHLLARRERRAEPLPTARFVPDRVATSVVRPDRLKDVALLALRLLALTLIGLAASRPTWTARASGTARIVIVDRGAGAWGPTVDVVQQLSQGVATSLVLVDSSARMTTVEQLSVREDSLAPAVAGSMSAAFVLAVREAQVLTRRFTRVELHVVSPMLTAELDAATLSIRRLWPDSVIIHDVPARPNESVMAGMETILSIDDPVGAAARLTQPIRADGRASIRIRRGAPTSDDIRWVGDAARILLVWPDSATTMRGIDTLDAVTSSTATVTGYFRRSGAAPIGRPIMWWSDGAVAAGEAVTGQGCVRSVAFSPSPRGDAAISFGVRRIMERLLAPCGATVLGEKAPANARGVLAAPGPPGRATPVPAPDGPRFLPAVLLLAAGLALLAEQWVRRPNATPAVRA